jgi:uncharacterized protein (DUF927 family)
MAQGHSDCLLVLDEISEVSPKEVGACAYMLANGSGKSRAARDGSPRPVFTWRLMFISSGELSLADKVSEDNRQRATAGQQVRVLDVPANAGAGLGVFQKLHKYTNSRDFADGLRAATRNYYGTAARTFIAGFIKRRGELSKLACELRDGFIKERCLNGADSQVYRGSSHFGLIAAAGELATQLGVTGWPEGTATNAVADVFAAWLKRRGHKGAIEIAEGIKAVRRFFILNPSRFADAKEQARPLFSDPTDPPPPPSGVKTASGSIVINRVGFEDSQFFWVYPEAFRSEIVRGFDSSAIAHALVERGLILPDPNGKTTCSKWDPASKRKTRLFCFTKKILGDEEEAALEDAEIDRDADADKEDHENEDVPF